MTHKMRTEQCLITRTSWNYTANPIQILLGSTFLRHVCCLSSRRALLRSRTRCVSHKLLKFTTADVHGLCQLYPLCPHLFLLGSRWLVNFQHWLFGNLLLVLSDQPTNVSIHSPNYKVPWGPTKAYIKELLLSPMVSLILKTFIIGPLRYEPNVDITGLAMVSKLQSFIAKLRFSRTALWLRNKLLASGTGQLYLCRHRLGKTDLGWNKVLPIGPGQLHLLGGSSLLRRTLFVSVRTFCIAQNLIWTLKTLMLFIYTSKTNLYNISRLATCLQTNFWWAFTKKNPTQKQGHQLQPTGPHIASARCLAASSATGAPMD